MNAKKLICSSAAVMMLGGVFSVCASAADTQEQIPITAYASIGGWYSSSGSNDWDKNMTDKNNRLRIGGTSSGVTSSYSSTDTKSCDSKVSFIKIDLTDIEPADKYELLLTYNGAVRTDRAGNYKIGCAVAYMDTTVADGASSFISLNGENAATWETSSDLAYCWGNRPQTGDIYMTDTYWKNEESPVIDVTDLISGQTGELTLAIFSEPYPGTYAEYYYTPSLTASYNEETSVTVNAPVEKITDDTTESDKDAVGFVGNLSVTGTAQIGFKVTAQKDDSEPIVKDWIYDTVISSDGAAGVVFGLVLTELSEMGYSRNGITAEHLY